MRYSQLCYGMTDGLQAPLSAVPLTNSQPTNGSFANCVALQYLIAREMLFKSMLVSDKHYTMYISAVFKTTLVRAV